MAFTAEQGLQRKKKKKRIVTGRHDEKFLGPEPDAKRYPLLGAGEKGYTAALNWYSYYYTRKDARKLMEEYLHANRPEQYKKFRKVDDYFINGTACFIARMLTNGIEINEKSMGFFETQLEGMLLQAGRKPGEAWDSPEEATEAPKETKISPFERVKRKAKAMREELEEVIDAFYEKYQSDFSMYSFAQAGNNKVFNSEALEYLQNILQELIDHEDHFKTEYGRRYRKVVEFYQGMISDLERFKENKKAVRAPRAKKAPTTEKLLKNFKYLEKYDPLQLVSVYPNKIIKAKEVWLFNVKSRAIEVLYASGPEGLSVKGTSIVGFVPETAVYKRLRKPEQQLKEFFEQGKVGLRKFMDTINANPGKSSGRVSKDTIILKVL